MHTAFQDNENFYLVLDYLSGGDLRYHIMRKVKFDEKQLSKRKIVSDWFLEFMVSCIVIALETVHAKHGLVHRDIKPENLVFDKKGYLHITDFGISKYNDKITNCGSGTPGYMAPEVILKDKHTYTVDYFAIGVICYELMLRVRPYQGKTKKDIKKKML